MGGYSCQQTLQLSRSYGLVSLSIDVLDFIYQGIDRLFAVVLRPTHIRLAYGRVVSLEGAPRGGGPLLLAVQIQLGTTTGGPRHYHLIPLIGLNVRA